MATGAFRSGAQIYLTYYAELLARLMDEGRIADDKIRTVI